MPLSEHTFMESGMEIGRPREIFITSQGLPGYNNKIDIEKDYFVDDTNKLPPSSTSTRLTDTFDMMIPWAFIFVFFIGSCFSLNCKQKNHYALTFDDGPYEGVTTELLDILKANKIKGTFFVCGSQLGTEKNANILKRIDAEGHIIGSHTWNHPNLNTLSDGQIVKEMNDTSDAIFEIIGKRPRLMRPPYGEAEPRVRILLKSMGYIIVGWSIDTLDWKTTQTPEMMGLAVKKGIQTDGNGIILMHDLNKKSCLGLKTILNHLKTDKCQIVPMDVCLANNNPYFNTNDYAERCEDDPQNPVNDGPFTENGSPNFEEIEQMMDSGAANAKNVGFIGMMFLCAGAFLLFL